MGNLFIFISSIVFCCLNDPRLERRSCWGETPLIVSLCSRSQLYGDPESWVFEGMGGIENCSVLKIPGNFQEKNPGKGNSSCLRWWLDYVVLIS